jgi:glycosyltransferase involved in cell wall biosynthesis
MKASPNSGDPGRPPRLLVAISSFCAEGTPILTLDLCRHWLRKGIEPVVVTLRPTPDDLEGEFRSAGISVHKLSLPAAGRRRFLQLAAEFHRLGRLHRADAFLSMPLGWHAFMAMGARLAGVRRVAAHVGNYPDAAAPSFAKFRLQVQVGRLVTSSLICCSAYVRAGVVDHFGLPASETEVIYNGVDVAEIERRSATVGPRDAGPFKVGMVARFEVHKDQPTLIRAAALLKAGGRPVEVWLIGDGSRRQEYERLIAELGLASSVTILGVRRDIPELLGRLDAFVFAAKPDEGLGVALIEAMAAGTPVVATDVGACREVLDGQELGLLVPAADPRALADAIGVVARDGAGARKRVEAARSKARRVFSIEAMASSYASSLGLSS